MEIQTRSIDKISIIKLTGRLDAHQGSRLAEELNQSVQTATHTIVNLSRVDFIDSSGLATLVKSMRRHREKTGDLLLCELQQPVQVIFALTFLDQTFRIFPTEQAALQSLH